jgi:hypothetical protein
MVAEEPDRLVKIDIAASAQHEGVPGRIADSLQLFEPPPPHRVSPDHSSRQCGERRGRAGSLEENGTGSASTGFVCSVHI